MEQVIWLPRLQKLGDLDRLRVAEGPVDTIDHNVLALSRPYSVWHSHRIFKCGRLA